MGLLDHMLSSFRPGRPDLNLETMLATMHRARDLGVEVIAFPEMCLPGYLIGFALIWWTRKGQRAGEIDERDKKVERRATEIAAIIVLLTIFLVSIGLYDAYIDSGSVPVGWLYIMAYGTIVWVSLLHPVLRLIIDFSGAADG